ncbi:cupin domain-containing protein (plasmid) [Micrococcaceae bacterium Sec5.7]
MARVDVIDNVLRSGFDMNEIDWEPWVEPGRKQVDRHMLWAPSEEDPSVGLLVRFPAGAHGDFHQHLGYELMLVLDGIIEHSDGRSWPKGTLIVEEPGTYHSMSSKEGCTFLAIRTHPTQPSTPVPPHEQNEG